jgi:hypothetical protein
MVWWSNSRSTSTAAEVDEEKTSKKTKTKPKKKKKRDDNDNNDDEGTKKPRKTKSVTAKKTKSITSAVERGETLVAVETKKDTMPIKRASSNKQKKKSRSIK